MRTWEGKHPKGVVRSRTSQVLTRLACSTLDGVVTCDAPGAGAPTNDSFYYNYQAFTIAAIEYSAEGRMGVPWGGPGWSGRRSPRRGG